MKGKQPNDFQKGEGEAGKKCKQELQRVWVCKVVDFLFFETKEKMFKQKLTNFRCPVYIKKKKKYVGKRCSSCLVKLIVTLHVFS